jgi:hypothetical protein
MRAFILAFFLMILCTASCVKRGEPFKQGGQLARAEKQSIAKMQPELTDWKADYTAFWNRYGVVRHIYFHRYGLTSMGWPYEVFIFDGDGTVVEANVLDGPNDSNPKSVLGITPLRVQFVGMHGSTTVEGFRYSSEEVRHTLQRQYEYSGKAKAVIESWKRSGDTNVTKLHEMLNNLQPWKTNLPK